MSNRLINSLQAIVPLFAALLIFYYLYRDIEKRSHFRST
ncbi:hypothetical protein ADICYQ_3734 [Cyclobacterium qasimii M12-11B]|uniref:Uncharacterized protein n=1 Tax=Cyclobacterium qasimii M12-11B TaxID=641524 RepID=S7WKE3_9BACT|nr:hypothetical protein ADICYQ_3734 [Cyclobacterium qasimii M12-11B]